MFDISQNYLRSQQISQTPFTSRRTVRSTDIVGGYSLDIVLKC